jgi:dUTP pyrophosphatase
MAKIPEHQTEGAAGMDLHSMDGCTLLSREMRLFGCGFAIEIPEGYCMLITPRSGLASKGVLITNSPGVVDHDYRGEVKVSLFNSGTAPVRIESGDRIAQAVIVPHLRVEAEVVDQLSETLRGAGGFGSTGK